MKSRRRDRRTRVGWLGNSHTHVLQLVTTPHVGDTKYHHNNI